tara:strand:+ start:89 stop:457 length:369 start_codon:yes stop_codon:yes gene_type:complete
MADLSKIAAQEIGEIALRHFQEINAHLDNEAALTQAVIERTQWLRMLTMGEMKLEYVQVLEDGQLRYNAPAAVTTTIEPPPVALPPLEPCVPSPEEPPATEVDVPEDVNGHRSAGELAYAAS